jgi:hypothetical protein
MFVMLGLLFMTITFVRHSLIRIRIRKRTASKPAFQQFDRDIVISHKILTIDYILRNIQAGLP